MLSASPGGHVELLIRAPATAGTYPLTVAAQTGISMTSAQFTLANFVVTGPPVSMSIPASLPAPSREYPLIQPSEIVQHRTITFHQGINGPPGSQIVLTGFYTWIDNGVRNGLYNEMGVEVRPAVNTAEEWTIINGTTCGHPFHIHVNSFELIEVNGKPLPTVQIYDTYMVPPAQAAQSGSQFDGYSPPGSIKIRIRFKQWTGKSVFHCHILTHEDTGMMNNILIQ